MRELEVTQSENEMRLDRWLKSHVPNLTQGLLQKHLRRGVIRLDGKKVKHNDRVSQGQMVRFPEYNDLDEPAPKAVMRLNEQQMQFAKSLIIAQTADWLAINKPSGLAVQGGSGVKQCVEDYFSAWQSSKSDEPLRLVHRLDKDTSGVLIIAKTRTAAQELAKAFKDKDMQKHYLAVLSGVPEKNEGVIRAPLAKRKSGGEEKMEVVSKNAPDAQVAVTEYKVLDTISDLAALVSLSPFTGRTHQLRVHCQSLGFAILGDPKYGGEEAVTAEMQLPKKLHLHAHHIRLDSMGIDVSAPLPEHIKETIAQCGFTL